ncbi:MAG: efflux RND transporter periplasmic adaptor subunit [Halothiobacillaceae bacterium]
MQKLFRPRYVLSLPMTLTAVLLLSACKESAPVAEFTRPAQVWTVSADFSPPVQVFAGEVRARYEADIAFRVGGKVVERSVELGQAVQTGQVLARLDAADLNLAVNASKAELAGAEADKLNAEQELKRIQGLFTQKFVGQSQLDAAIAARNGAASRVNALRAQSAQSGNQAGYSALLASKPGVVTAVNLELGQVVSAGAPVLRVAYAGEREVHVRVGEVSVQAFTQALEQQQGVNIGLWSRPDILLNGQVREIAPITNEASSVLVKISVPDMPDNLVLGATAEVRLPQAVQAGEAWLPSTALFQQGDKPAVWVLNKDDAVRLQAVTVRRYLRDGVIVQGLAAGSKVIAAGVHTLHDGQVVKPVAFDGLGEFGRRAESTLTPSRLRPPRFALPASGRGEQNQGRYACGRGEGNRLAVTHGFERAL